MFLKQLKTKQKSKGGFLGVLLWTVRGGVLGNMLKSKGFIRVGEGTTGPKGQLITTAG